MKKKIFTILLLIIGILIPSFGDSVTQTDSAVSYHAYMGNVPDFLEDKSSLSALKNGIKTEISSSVTSHLLSFGGRGKYLCGGLYQIDDEGSMNSVPISNEFLTNFNVSTGEYSCVYYVEGNKNAISKTYRIPGWFLLVNDYNLNTGELNNYTIFESIDENSTFNFSIIRDAQSIGIFPVNDKISFKNLTLSKFVVNLITLNSDYVEGVKENGEIIYNPDVEANLTVINHKDYTDSDSVFGKIWNFVTSLTGSSDKDRFLSNLQSLSPTEYFDKKLFGLYYSFMTVGWGKIFNYAGVLFLAFLSLYLGGNIGLRYALHKIEHDKESVSFDFPVKPRLVFIGLSLVLSFLQFPTGNAGMKVPNPRSGTEDTYYAQTSFAKMLISYMGTMGTNIADSANGIMQTIYMKYLLDANGNHSIDTIKQLIREQKKEAIAQKTRLLIYHDACKALYSNTLQKYHDFQGFSSVAQDSEWNMGINPNWYNNFAYPYFGDAEQAKKRNAKTALYFCAKLEKEIAVGYDNLQKNKEEIDRSIELLKKYKGDSGVNLGKIFADSQLIAARDMGWFSSASIPVLQVFLKNVNLIQVADSIKEVKNSHYNTTSVMTINNLNSYNSKNGNEEEEKYIHEDLQKSEEGISDGIKYVLSQQVYFMLPFFDSVFNNLGKPIASGVVNMGSSFFGMIWDFLPSGGFVKKTFNKITGWISPFSDKKSSDGNSGASNVGAGLKSLLIVVAGFMIATYLYNMMVKIIFAAIVSILITIKIIFYIVDVFIYYFVSPFVVGWQMTIQNQSSKLHTYISRGFVLLVVKPSLIVFSTMLFVVGIEVMHSMFHIITDIIYSSLELANDLLQSEEQGIGSSLSAVLILSNIKGIGDIFVDIAGVILAYKLIMEGDSLMLEKFGYRDETESGIGQQVSEKIKTLAAAHL